MPTGDGTGPKGKEPGKGKGQGRCSPGKANKRIGKKTGQGKRQHRGTADGQARNKGHQIGTKCKTKDR